MSKSWKNSSLKAVQNYSHTCKIQLTTDPEMPEKLVKGIKTLERNPKVKLTVEEIPEDRNDELYKHAMSVKNDGNIVKIADNLVKIAKSEYERAKLVYMWLGENLKYDLESCKKGKIPNQSAEAVLRSGKSVCAGFSTLGKQIGQRVGLNILEIEGYAKKKSGETGYKWEKPNHAWNVVRLENGRDLLFDATWGAGQSSSKQMKKCKKDVWTKEYRDYWFDTGVSKKENLILKNLVESITHL